MDYEWMDKDGQRWHVHAYNSVGAMATAGRIPDAGENRIRFRRHDASDGYTVETQDPNEMTDDALQELLDQAKGAEELERG